MALDLKPLVHRILEEYSLPWHGVHGVGIGPGYWKMGFGWPGRPRPRSKSKAAKNPEMLKWADGRACFEVIPQLVSREWGIDTWQSGPDS